MQTDFKLNVGRSSSRIVEPITRESIDRFCRAVNAEANRVAPATFLTLFRKGEFELFKDLGITLSSVLHTDQEYSFDADVVAGDVLAYTTKLVSVLEKKGNTKSLLFLSFDSEFVSEVSGNNIAVSKTTCVVRR